MKFGKVDDPGSIDFTLPPDHPDTKVLLNSKATNEKPQLYVGCAKWNKQDLKKLLSTWDKRRIGLLFFPVQFN